MCFSQGPRCRCLSPSAPTTWSGQGFGTPWSLLANIHTQNQAVRAIYYASLSLSLSSSFTIISLLSLKKKISRLTPIGCIKTAFLTAFLPLFFLKPLFLCVFSLYFDPLAAVSSINSKFISLGFYSTDSKRDSKKKKKKEKVIVITYYFIYTMNK